MKRIIIFILFIFCVLSLAGCKKNIRFDEEYVVDILDGRVVNGKEAMDSFYTRTRNGEKLKIVFNQSDSSSGTSDSVYIIFDGKYYVTNEQVLENDPQKRKFKYLNYSETDGIGDLIIKTEAYCLSNDKYMTYERIIYSWFSSMLGEAIHDSIPVYQYLYYKDLCFENNEVSNITYNDRTYPVNSFSKSKSIDIVDNLSWHKEKPAEYDNNHWNLRIRMARTILNDVHNLIPGEEGDKINIQYQFDFEKKIAILNYPHLSSISEQLYASLTDEDIEKAKKLFGIFQGGSGTNWGEYVAYYNDKEIIFEINDDETGKIYIKDTDVVEIIDNIVIFGDGKLRLESNDGRNMYVFAMNGEQRGGYTYIGVESNPSRLLSQYFKSKLFFKWIGYPCD